MQWCWQSTRGETAPHSPATDFSVDPRLHITHTVTTTSTTSIYGCCSTRNCVSWFPVGFSTCARTPPPWVLERRRYYMRTNALLSANHHCQGTQGNMSKH